MDTVNSDTRSAEQTVMVARPSTIPVEIEMVEQFLTMVFEAEEMILIRPIETWTTDRGKKQSRLDFKNMKYLQANVVSPSAIQTLLEQSEQSATNTFFGVCPRFGSGGKYDLAWQIRTVRCLWADIDHCTVDEARERIAKAGLPEPSIIVNSGNGVHVYWLLDEPYLIDDVGDPIPVENEWPKSQGGKKKPPRKYVLEDGERIYLEQRPDVVRLSPQALHIQGIVAGISQQIDGDSTHDLARLLRLPGSMNRKNQRNGDDPKPCILVECEPTRRYALTDFEKYKVESADTKHEQKIASMTLPVTRKPSARKLNNLADYINKSAVAPTGSRSEVDFSLCCFVIENGIDKEHVWSQVKDIGKFAESGRQYFDRTWAAATHKCKEDQYNKTQYSLSKNANGAASVLQQLEQRSKFQNNIVADPALPISLVFDQITDRLVSAGYCFTRADHLVAMRNDGNITTVVDSKGLAGLLSEMAECHFAGGEAGKYKTLPTNYGDTWLHNYHQRKRLPEIKLFTRNPVYTDDWRLITPGFDKPTGFYYAGPEISVREGTEYLDKLLHDFCFKTVADRTNFIGMLMTILLVPRFIGSKPALLLNGNQPGLGKSSLAQILAFLRDGEPAQTATYTTNDEEFEKRLGALVYGGATTIIVDNAKSSGRNPRIESAVLERSITDLILSYRLLGKSEMIRAENSHIFCITANTSSVSRDLITRSVPVNLYYEGDPTRRDFSMDDPEGYALEHRIEILGELMGMVERWKTVGMREANVKSRFNKKGWSKINGGILAEAREPDFLDNDTEAATSLDEDRRDFADVVAVLADHEHGVWKSAEIVKLCDKENIFQTQLGDGSARSRATAFGLIASRFVGEKFTLDDGRGIIFTRDKSGKNTLYKVRIDDPSDDS
ncbi:hypothetical protein [Symmachiella dynata]|uniref:hypothetical protein n=1 Tax=Symmachiella dynata TaxID=2527995 RepID=UPI0030EBA3A8